MVEGSQVDWAGHNNDPIYMVTDFLAFDDAVKVAVDFAAEDGDTLVLAFPDHNTGGMKIGQYDAKVAYTATTIDDLIGPLEGMRVTSESVVSEIGGDYSEANMIATIKEWWDINATTDDIAEINDLAPSVGMAYALARVISKNHTVIGWTTHGHNGEDVPVWIYPHSEAIGVVDNTDLPDVEEFWPTRRGPRTLDELTEKLYVNVEDAFPGEWTLDKSDPENPVLVVKNSAELPVSKDLLIIGKKKYQLGSLVVYAPLRDGDASDDGSIHTVVEERVYIPKRAVKMIKFMCR
jgi:alkaline phosphatase